MMLFCPAVLAVYWSCADKIYAINDGQENEYTLSSCYDLPKIIVAPSNMWLASFSIHILLGLMLQ